MYYLVDLAHDMNETRVIFTFLEDKFVDSKKVYLVINLTRSNYTDENSTFYIQANTSDKPRQYSLFYQEAFETVKSDEY